MVTGQDKAVIAFVSTAGALGRGLTTPPKTPKHVIATLRKAYDAMNADPAFAADLKKRRLRLIPTTGDVLQKIVNQAITDAKPAVVKRAATLVYGGSS